MAAKPSQTGTDSIPGAAPLTAKGDLAAAMVAGISRDLDRRNREAVEKRERHWQRDLSSPAAYAKSVARNRRELARIIGLVDEREPVRFELFGQTGPRVLCEAPVAMANDYQVTRARWAVLPGVEAEGLVLDPWDEPVADIIALPDCDWTPDMFIGIEDGLPPEAQFARRLAEAGCRVLVPWLINRRDDHSIAAVTLATNQPHREFIYRPAFELGRHIIGYEVQKVLAVLDWLKSGRTGRPIAVAGYGEGGLVALYAAALDPRIDAALVSGYFGPREELWREPIYRNVWALLDQFGDAELATLIAPRTLVVEHCPVPEVSGPPPPCEGRSGAAPGALSTPSFAAVQRELDRAKALVEGLETDFRLVRSKTGLPGSDKALAGLLQGLGVAEALPEPGEVPEITRELEDGEITHRRQFLQVLGHTQHALREAEFARKDFWRKATGATVKDWGRQCRQYRKYLWEEVIGKLPEPELPANPRARRVSETQDFTGYEIMLDVYPDVFAYGILLLPSDLREGERRPVVVCQHGLEGRPQDVADPGNEVPAYKQFACRLASKGYITYAPQNPYIGYDDFRVLQRKANPLKLSLFSYIVRQHQQTLGWLKSLPWVDPRRIAFYGLSYGGKTAMRVPALLEDYCLSICSADYDEWIWKNCSTRHTYTYLHTGEYEMPEFDLGNTFNYAEMSWLICPRPFMVERGHFDGVAPDEWVAYEYARTRFRYDILGIGDRTEMEVFNGPHAINGVGTFAFLDRHLKGET